MPAPTMSATLMPDCLYALFMPTFLHALMLSDIACLWLTQVLAVSVSAVTDLWMRQAFVKADQLQQQQQQQRFALAVSQDTAATTAVRRKAVKRVMRTTMGTSST